MNGNAICPEQTLRHWHAAMRWLLAGIAHQNGRGAPAFASRWRYPLRGWSPSYPETTGYLIETLLHPRVRSNFPEAEAAAQSCSEWLLQVQNTNGSFPSGYAQSGKPSVFNSTQILFGLLEAAAYWKDLRFEEAARQTFHWLVELLDETGLWQQAAYVPGYVPSYYTRALWPVILAAKILQMPEQEPLLRKALRRYMDRWRPDGTVRDWGFSAGAPAHTHTVAYTLRGLLECGLLLQEEEAIRMAEHSARSLCVSYEEHGRLAGSYSEGWKGNYAHLCVTGNLQLSCFLFRLHQLRPDPIYVHYARCFLADALPAQRLRGGADVFGAVPGSVPFYGAYLPLRYPGWAAKFLIDACILSS
jgi:hypothetical protein